MEDGSQGSRRSRISSTTTRMPLYHDSAANCSSSNTRTNMVTSTVSSQSTNSSSAHLPLGSGRTSAQSGGAAFLQERLRERKGRDRRLSGDFSGSGIMAREVQSSPIHRNNGGSGVMREREERRPSSSGVGQPLGKKAMGVKQMEETVSTLHKQNFDLKLELFHRRQRQEILESEAEQLKNQIKQQSEVQEINDALLKELEKRDQAVEEAVGLICELEAKVERLLQEREDVRNYEIQYGNDFYDHNSADEMPSSPPIFDRDTSRTPRAGDTTVGIARMPSFLSERSEGVEALRSLYLPSSNSISDIALPKLPEEGSESGMASPSLSVLSESSFLSIYGEKSPLAVNGEDYDSPSPKQHRRTSSSVEKWIDERPASTMPMRVPSPSSQTGGQRSRFLSMNYVAASPLQRLEKLRSNLEKQYNSSTSMRLKIRSDKRDSIHERQKFHEDSSQLTTDGNNYEATQKLPPTPDTISTGTLRSHKESDETLNQRHQVNEDEVTFLHSTSTFSVPPVTYNPYQSTTSMRPRSAGETVTSRREGHGWDTETLETDDIDTFTNYSTDSVAESSKMHPPTRQPRGGNHTPEFFSFNTTSRERDTMRAWGGDGIYNDHPATRVPTGANSSSRDANAMAQRYEMLRTVSQAESHPRSDATVTTGHSDRRSHSRIEEHRERRARELERSSTPLDEKTPKPPAPDRRSSLAAATSKLRKHAPSSISTSHDSNSHDSNPKMPLAPVSMSIPNTPSRESSREKEGGKEKDFRRLLPTRLFFGRSDTAPVVNTSQSTSRSSSSSNSNLDRRTKYQTMPASRHGYRYSSRSALGDYQLDGSEETGNRVGKSTYHEEDEVEIEKDRSATPPPIPRNRTHSAQVQRELLGRPRSACAVVRERGEFGEDGANDGDEVSREVISGAGDESKGVKSGIGKEKRENCHVDMAEESNKKNDATKDKDNNDGAATGHGRKWFGLSHKPVLGRSASVSKGR
ncbi:hypothetical protein BELL_0056g00180 [Botrytis elliptica]|uniref:Centrosomin N-terminal motif 1 domain-containing protein n=1 Tax=Botrytis elliptica TaxID=278938 RepID=A0A4Z1JZD2_9HELO|nr:hypothetical protein EAE99_000150 [Botrytis elliptica]TGO78726.1 hypothetical protein BELL_0056g00180 [Botrytis elliptica]